MIRTPFRLVCVALVMGGLVALPGCGGAKPAEKKPAKTGHYEGDGHDHSKDKKAHREGDGHDHSKDKKAHREDDGHDHSKDKHDKGDKPK